MTTNSPANNFTASIIEEIGTISISNTQQYRILLVKDEDMGTRISAQKWWRKGEDEDWNVGKGFFLSGREAVKMGKMLQEAGSKIMHVK